MANKWSSMSYTNNVNNRGDTFSQVLDGSHKHFEEFAHGVVPVGKGSLEFRPCTEKEVEFFVEEKGCEIVPVAVKKGSMVLWDSRTVHDNVPPQLARAHPGRWRYIVFICMGPAAWATEQDLKLKKEVYDNIKSTSHWPSRDVYIFERKHPSQDLAQLPEIAQTDEAKYMAGVLAYDFNDGQPNGPPLPTYKDKGNTPASSGVNQQSKDDAYG